MSEPSEMEEPKEEREPWSIPLSSKLAVPKAVWVPVLIYTLCLLFAYLPREILKSNLSWRYVSVLSWVSSLFVYGQYFLVLWGALSIRSKVVRIPVAIFSIWFLTMMQMPYQFNWITLLSLVVYPTTYWIAFTLWRSRYGWQMIDSLKRASESRGYSIRYLLTLTTMTALMLMIGRLMNELLPDMGLLGNAIPSGTTMLVASLASLTFSIPTLLLAMILLMDLELMFQRGAFLVVLQMILSSGRLAYYYYAYSIPGMTLGSWIAGSIFQAILPITGIILIGLALRWAGYRIVRQLP